MKVGCVLLPPAFLLVRTPSTCIFYRQGQDGEIQVDYTFDAKGGADTLSSHAMFAIEGA